LPLKLTTYLGLVLGFATHLGMGTADAQLQFVEVGDAVGLGDFTMESGQVSGAVSADFDDDGDIDLFIPNKRGVPDQLYRNLGDGRFEEIAAQSGVASAESSRVALWFDYDGDHLLDLIVASDCYRQEETCPDDGLTLHLYRQVAEASFEEVTLEAGITEDLISATGQHRGGMAAGDINNDGFLDLVLGVWKGGNRVLLNNGNGTFSDITNVSGLGDDEEQSWQEVMYDFNGDGWLDIYTAVDSGESRLWINQRNNTFVDVASSAGVTSGRTGMGTTLGDYDNDGDLDLYETNININRLFRNDSVDGTLQFSEVAEEAGVAEVGWAWGCTFFDANNDGLLDLAVTNGFHFPWTVDPSRFFLNQGGDPVTFADVSDAVGFNDTYYGCSLFALDYDRDGDLDLVQTTQASEGEPSRLRLLQNQLGAESRQNNFLVIKPRMDGPNHRAIGSVVRAQVGDVTMMRLIMAGTSAMGQEPAEAHFGLGTAEFVDEVTIQWPDGTESVFQNISANQVLTLNNTSQNPGEGEGESAEGGEGDVDGEGGFSGEGEDEGESETVDEGESETVDEGERESAEGGEGEDEGESETVDEGERESAEGGEVEREQEANSEGDSEQADQLQNSYGPQAAVATSVSSLGSIRYFRDRVLAGTRTGDTLEEIYYSRQVEETVGQLFGSFTAVSVIHSVVYRPVILFLETCLVLKVMVLAGLLGSLRPVARVFQKYLKRQTKS